MPPEVSKINRFTGLAKQDTVYLSHMQFGVVRRDLPGFSSNFSFLQKRKEVA